MRRERQRPPATEVQFARRYWRTQTVSGGCVMCRHHPPPAEVRQTHAPELARMEGHHILPKQLLRREGFHGRLWDTRNGIGLCGYHHARHENYIERVPRDVLPNEAFDFADELDLGWAIDKEYP